MQKVIDQSNGGLSSGSLMSKIAPPHPWANDSALSIDHSSMLSLTVPYSLSFLRATLTPSTSESLTWDGVTPPPPIQTLIFISVVPDMQYLELYPSPDNRNHSMKCITTPRLWSVGEGEGSHNRILPTVAFMAPEQLNVHMFLPEDVSVGQVYTTTFYQTEAPQLLELNLIDSGVYTQVAALESFQTESLQKLDVGVDANIDRQFDSLNMSDSGLEYALRDFVRV